MVWGALIALFITCLLLTPRNDVSKDALQLICFEVEPPRCKSFLIVAWYKPPNKGIDNYIKLERVLSCLDKEKKEMILLGETNCDLSTKLTNQFANCDTKRIRALYDLFSFKQLIVEPTRKMKHFNEEAFVADVACIMLGTNALRNRRY